MTEYMVYTIDCLDQAEYFDSAFSVEEMQTVYALAQEEGDAFVNLIDEDNPDRPRTILKSW